MKTKIICCSVLLALRLHGNDSAPDVMHVSLDSSTLVRIPVAIDRVTTVSFPAPISGLEAAFISQEPSLLSRFHLSYQNGSRYFSLRALTTGVRANLNVVVGREIYALEFVESNRAVSLVEFTAARPAKANDFAAISPDELPANLDTVNNFKRVPAEHVKGHGAVHVLYPATVWQLGACTACVRQLFYFEADDKLFFEISFENTSAAPLYYSPSSVGVQLGAKVYYASPVQCTGCLPAQTNVILTLAVDCKSGGGGDALTYTNVFAPYLGHITSASVGEAPPATATRSIPPLAPQRAMHASVEKAGKPPFVFDFHVK